MESVTLAVIGAVIGIISAMSGVVLGWAGNAKANKKILVEKTTSDVQLRTDVEYIKRGIDDIRTDVRTQGQRVDDLCDRVARVEESAKSAHKRLDEHVGGMEK